jgi:hypothetical protein
MAQIRSREIYLVELGLQLSFSSTTGERWLFAGKNRMRGTKPPRGSVPFTAYVRDTPSPARAAGRSRNRPLRR